MNMIRVSGIYKIVNKINGKYYVGSSIDIFGGTNHEGRLKRHLKRLRKGIHENPHLQNAWNKYGEKNFNFMLVEEVNKDVLLLTEQKYLDIAKSEQDYCYNIVFTASNSGINIEFERRERMKKSAKTKIFSNEHRDNIRKYRSGIGTDPTVYTWSNRNTGQTFVGSKFEWYSKFGFTYKWAYRLVSGERNSHRGWVVTKQ